MTLKRLAGSAWACGVPNRCFLSVGVLDPPANERAARTNTRYFAEGTSTGYPAPIQALVPPLTFRRFENPCCSRMLEAALER